MLSYQTRSPGDRFRWIQRLRPRHSAITRPGTRCAPGAPEMKPQNHGSGRRMSCHELSLSSMAQPKRSPYPHATCSEVGTPIHMFLGLFFPSPTPTYTKSEGPGRSWKKKSTSHAKSVAVHRTHRVGCWDGHWFGEEREYRPLEASFCYKSRIFRLSHHASAHGVYRTGVYQSAVV